MRGLPKFKLLLAVAFIAINPQALSCGLEAVEYFAHELKRGERSRPLELSEAQTLLAHVNKVHDQTESLRLRPTKTVKLGENLAASGYNNAGVFEIGKNFVVKFAHAFNLKKSLLLHAVIGELGLAPRVRGVIKGEPLKQLASDNRINLIAEFTGATSDAAIIMDRFDGWNPKDGKAPEWFRQLDRVEIENQIRNLFKMLETLHIENIHDPQVMISRSGKVQLIDLEMINYLPNAKVDNRSGIAYVLQTIEENR